MLYIWKLLPIMILMAVERLGEIFFFSNRDYDTSWLFIWVNQSKFELSQNRVWTSTYALWVVCDLTLNLWMKIASKIVSIFKHGHVVIWRIFWVKFEYANDYYCKWGNKICQFTKCQTPNLEIKLYISLTNVRGIE